MAATVITIFNEKGGVGKTQTSQSLASFLAQKGLNTCLVDLDKQADLTSNLDIPNDKTNIYEISSGEKPLGVEQINDHLWIIPGSKRMTDFDKIEWAGGPEYILHDQLKPLLEDIDFLIFDCRPDIDALETFNALVMSDYIIIPTDPHASSMSGIKSVLHLVKHIQDEYNPKLSVLGILITLYMQKTSLHKDMKGQLYDSYGDMMFDTVIRHSITAQEQTTLGIEITDYTLWKEENSKVKPKTETSVVIDYRTLALEVIERVNAFKSLRNEQKLISK